MHSQCKSDLTNLSTPKRKRLGTGRIIRNPDGWRKKFVDSCTPVSQKIAASLLKTPERCESPALPCNQVEYLHDSGNTSVCSDIPCSPGIDDINDVSNWKSLLTKSDASETRISFTQNEISDEMFQSKLELEPTQIGICDARAVEELRQEVDTTFEAVNESIINHRRESLFETKDSFLLDIQTGNVIEENHVNNDNKRGKSRVENQDEDINSFYGLPMITKSLFKTYRNIEKFYDWQEECLNLDAVKQRQNLIYALPTSGGKTLVAEVLMLKEVLNRRHNALFILPFVAIVQEKIWALSPFALQLEFLLEEYTGGKGHIPPKKRRKKNSIYIATIEKGLALVRSLIELDRLDEIGLIVVDELHLIGEPDRGGTLETLLTTVIFANKGIQIVGMSATIGNVPQLARFLRAHVFTSQFRPVELLEYVKLGDWLCRLRRGAEGLEAVRERRLDCGVSGASQYSAAAARLDPDRLAALVGEVVPRAACLVFCPTRRSAESVAALLAQLLPGAMRSHRAGERAALARALRAEGAGAALLRAAGAGVAYHHAGLAADERALLEHAYRSGVISALCCTSTLAAGVNLPARRVLVRAPRVGREPLTLAHYRQMAGRAGRAGVCDSGESILICEEREWAAVRARLAGALPPARSALPPALPALLLGAAALRLASTPRALRALADVTLLAIDPPDGSPGIEQEFEAALRSLLDSGVLEPAGGGDCGLDDQLAVSALGRAAVKSCLPLAAAAQLQLELRQAARALVALGALHLLYLVTPPAAAPRPDYAHYYTLYSNLDEEGVCTARVLGITEVNAVRMMTGKPITNVPESVLSRFYLALMLHDLWKEVPVPVVAEKYRLQRGAVQAALAAAVAGAGAALRFCEELPALWPFRALLDALAARLRHCAAPGLARLLDLPGVRKARALQLVRAGYKRVEDLAKASAEALTDAVPHLSRTAATHLISAARLMLIEKVENLRAEAEDVMDELS